MADRNPNYGVAALAATEALAHYGRGNLDATLAYVGLADAYLDLAETEDTLADALRVGLEECEALRAERDAERLDAKSSRLLLLGDYAALGRALGLGSAPLSIDQATEAARALLVERNALRAALAVQAAAVRQHDAAQATLRAAEARDAATLRRREDTPGDTLAELAAAREEARRWNARATELETERDETLRRVRVALGALGVADCDDPIAALEALAEEVPRREAEEVPRREAEALDERNAAVLRAYAEGEARGVQKALEALRRRLADVAAELGGRAYGYNVDKLATQADTLDDAVASVAALTPSKGAEVSRG